MDDVLNDDGIYEDPDPYFARIDVFLICLVFVFVCLVVDKRLFVWVVLCNRRDKIEVDKILTIFTKTPSFHFYPIMAMNMIFVCKIACVLINCRSFIHSLFLH
jgi:hypothetical protein